MGRGLIHEDKVIQNCLFLTETYSTNEKEMGATNCSAKLLLCVLKTKLFKVLENTSCYKMKLVSGRIDGDFEEILSSLLPTGIGRKV